MLIRRSAIAALCLLLLSAVNVAAAGATVKVVNYAFKSTPTLNVGGTVAWNNTSNKKHTASPNINIVWNPLSLNPGTTSAAQTMSQAGTFLYHCAIHAQMKGKIKVKPISTPTTDPATFVITLGLTAAPSQFVHEIQIRVDGGAWENRAGTAAATMNFVTTSGGTYQLRTRMVYQLGSAATNWSPPVTLLP